MGCVLQGCAVRLYWIVNAVIFSARSVREVNSPRRSRALVSTENHSSAVSSQVARFGV